MKNKVLLALLLVLTGSLFAQETDTRNYREEACEILDKGNKAFKKQQKEALSDIVFHLSDTDRQDLFDSYKKKSFTAVALNWIPGFGTGSYSQGDNLGGTVILVCDLCTVGAAVVGTGYLLAGLIVAIFEAPLASLSGTEASETDKLLGRAGISFLIGAGLWACTRVFGSVRPVVYKKSYNKRLRSALELDKAVTVEPVASVLQNKAGLQMRPGFVATIKL